MMNIISKIICLSVFSLVCPTVTSASLTSAYASIVDTSQNQTFESEPQALSLVLPGQESSPIKLAAVHFITNDNALNFGNQEFKPEDLCKMGGYLYESCPAGYVKEEACPEDNRFYKKCIEAGNWCKSNGYLITTCAIPQYPVSPCPYLSSLYKSCEVDNIRACKEAGYSLICEAGKIGDTAQVCPYNSSYKKCICNPCSGYAYTAAQASAQGYTPGEVCNSCGTIKYKRTENKCEGFKECTEGGTASAKICYSGNIKKFSECKEVCDSKFQYDSSNCNGGRQLAGYSCGGKYDSCQLPLQYLYSDKTLSSDIIPGKSIIGIAVDPENRLAVAIDYISEISGWGGYGIDIPTLENTPWTGAGVYVPGERNDYFIRDGKENTAKILAYGRANGISYPMAETANKYFPSACSAGSWCGKGKWFLPSNWQVFPYFDNRETILSMLKAINKLPDDWWYTRKDLYVQTSNEIDAEQSGFIYINRGGMAHGSKNMDGQGFALIFITY